MTYRLKFSKQGRLKFISHLDLLRLWQKAIKMAKIPVAYSQGFNPHQKLLIAFPLSLGLESIGEYIDIDTLEKLNEQDVLDKLNNIMPKGIEVFNIRLLDNEKNAMAVIEAASYEIEIPIELQNNTEEIISNYLQQPTIFIEKKSKSGTKIEDIKNQIYKLAIENNKISLVVIAGNTTNLRAESVIESIYTFLKLNEKENFDKTMLKIVRTNLYKDSLIPLNN